MAAGDGLVTMTPTSIVVTGAGSSASINSDGGVDFASATSLSLNGVFTSSHDNYLMVCIVDSTSDGNGFTFRMRAAGTDASGTDYTRQSLVGNGSATPSGARTTSLTSGALNITGTEWSGFHAHFYGPYLAQPTAVRSVVMSAWNTAAIYDWATTHSLSTSYDGITFDSLGTAGTGTVVVFGYEE